MNNACLKLFALLHSKLHEGADESGEMLLSKTSLMYHSAELYCNFVLFFLYVSAISVYYFATTMLATLEMCITLPMKLLKN